MAARLTWSCASGRDQLRIEDLPSADLGRLRMLPAHALAPEVPVFASELLDDHGGTQVAPVLAHRLTPMQGEYGCDDAAITFTPRHALLRGRSYTAVVGDRCLTVEVPAPERGDATTVVGIHPSLRVLPRNLLRCYVEFSARMSEGDAARCVSVVDASGVPLEGALLDMDPELWDPQRRRLTVLFDPARLKRGLAPHREAGYPLHEGETVALVVAAAMRDAGGRPLAQDARRRFAVGPDVRTRVDPADWIVGPVAAGSPGALVVTFDRALDHALLQHCVTVLDRRGARVRGRGVPARHDTAWSFVPDRPWVAAPYGLAVDPILEDVCGNSVTRVFDRDAADPAHARGPDQPVVLTFVPC